MTTDVEAIIRANESFYRAFRERDTAAMEAMWAADAEVAVIHPGWAPLFGRERVLASWHAILGNDGSPQVYCTDVHVLLRGDTALVICTENLPSGTLVATNIFARRDDGWRMVHHQAGAAPPAPAPEAGESVH